ncbi:MAG: ATP-binding protein, partial [Candidatus Dormibacteraceae bacterium]
LSDSFRVNSSTREVNLLAGALNRAARARQQVEAELRKAKEGAEAASRTKSEFLANVSHELRTPMNGILGLTGLLQESELSPDQREELDLVQHSAHALMAIINDMLDFSQAEAGEVTLEAMEFSPHDCVGDIVNAMWPKARDKGLELSGDVRPDVPDVVMGDPMRLRQVLNQLVGNALKFTERGNVVVRAKMEQQDQDGYILQFVVEDTGIGIPAEKQKVIFEPFSQADGSFTRKYGGTGLGLTLASRIVAMMQGDIWVESEVGRGSSFHFTLRLGVPSESAVQPPACKDNLTIFAGPNVLDAPLLKNDRTAV